MDNPTNTSSIVEEVNTILNNSKGEGKLVIPDDASPHVADLARAEHKFRSTQAGYTKQSQRVKELEAENVVLRDNLAPQVTPEEAARLEELKYTDPDAWHKALVAQETPDLGKDARTKAGHAYELERRGEVLAEFNQGRAVPITNEVVQNDIPPRITNKLEDGSITFEEFLDEVSTYMSKGKAIANPADMGQTDIGDIAGGDIPTKDGPITETGRYVDLAQSSDII